MEIKLLILVEVVKSIDNYSRVDDNLEQICDED